MTEPIAWLNGNYIPFSQAALPVWDMGVVGGAAVTEMLRTFRHVPFRLEEHLDRLFASIRSVGFTPEITYDELRDVVQSVVARNVALIPAGHDLGVIAFVTSGGNLTYLGAAGRELAQKCTVCVHTFPLPFELWADRYETGVHLVTPATKALPADVIDPQIKFRSRLHWQLADREARLVDPAAMSLLLDRDGYVTEAATGNVVALDGDRLLTPSHVRSLAGISLQVVEDLAPALGCQLIRGDWALHDFERASEIFLTSTPHCLLPVTRLNSIPVGDGRPGPLTRRLLTAWGELAGVDIASQMRQGAADRTR
ncbi:aminotransferase class IV [Planctellipticum variicoloris]|uniref:aminotransferase class IV n=1 Tax=Planctellipticum variicoloris TaxID=3064265 RepID=UPI0030136022|nr:aminotransferase class IV [Planctomycetaceae bacterium SH412]